MSVGDVSDGLNHLLQILERADLGLVCVGHNLGLMVKASVSHKEMDP